jgi:holo-[acyl-carrier protein] synthase
VELYAGNPANTRRQSRFGPVLSSLGGLMVIGLGVDLVEMDRVQQALDRWGDRFVAKLMEPEEADRLPLEEEGRRRALALAIAGKEAASKALGTGWSRGVRWRDVDVDLGPPPRLTLRGAAARRAEQLGATPRVQLILEARGELALAQVRLFG